MFLNYFSLKTSTLKVLFCVRTRLKTAAIPKLIPLDHGKTILQSVTISHYSVIPAESFQPEQPRASEVQQLAADDVCVINNHKNCKISETKM